MNRIQDLSDLMSSGKRVIILKVIKDYTFSGYTTLKNELESKGLSLVSSECYKHIRFLKKLGLVEHQDQKFRITEKGEDFVNLMELMVEIIDEKEGK